MIETVFRVTLPEELLKELMQAIRDFDMKHDPEREGKVQFELLTESDWPTEKIAEVLRAVTPTPEFFGTVLTAKDDVAELRAALAELVSKYERKAERSALIAQDADCGALYLHFQPERRDERGAAAETRTVEAHVDLDRDGNVFGVEIVEPLRLAVPE